MTATTDYERQAANFLEKYGLTFSAEYVSAECPKFCEKCNGDKYRLPCGGIHGGKYRITLRGDRRVLSFDFWNSYNDEYGAAEVFIAKHAKPTDAAYFARQWRELPLSSRRTRPDIYGSYFVRASSKSIVIAKPPTTYDVLAGMASDANTPGDFADFCSEYGYDEDSRKAEAAHKACCAYALKLRQFFTTDELKDLEEIN